MRNFSAMTITAMLASASLVNSAFCASTRWSKNTVGVPPYQYGSWDKDHQRGGWGPGGRWVRHGHQWVYRWRQPSRELALMRVDGKPVRLTGKEYGILELLSLRKGATVTKEMFLTHLYDRVHEPQIKIIDVFVCMLRKKLVQATGGNHYIETIWGRGYALRDPAPPLTRAKN